jgi:tripartite-type tricarboxylate transporter receptor subunit TctC
VPGAVVTRIHADVVRVLKDPAIADKLSGMGATAIGNEPGEFAAAMRSDSEKWGKLIREAHIKAE